MVTKQGDVALLRDPVAEELLRSRNLAHLAYIWSDGTPRVVPIWFHWNGQAMVFGTFASAPKLKAIRSGSKLAATITSADPSRVLYIRGTARLEVVDGVVPEYVLAAKRYLGDAAGTGWIQQVGSLFPQTTRITLVPEWAGVLDFEQRLPSAIEKAMAGPGG
ncbi:MAG: pyridoxamine 5'-phosphate oxidase family protein [Anaerolineae bacterium]|nr:pyridoxamine 5'-phosphate oxidase family protein [Anaerolineae bacterium]NUQ06434.1 pyridoxamine 5'-phosphate oxidase family protein [Anaerolineae bacterium]